MDAKTQKTIARLLEKIEEGQPYEAQQQTRVIASRYVKSKKYDLAIEVLFNVAEALLKAGKGGSGGDLSVMLIDVYQQAELKPNPDNKGKLLALLRQFDSEEHTREKFIGEIISWSGKFGPYPAGEPDLHHFIGSTYAEEFDIYKAERHLTLGTKDSPKVLANLEYEWYCQDEPHTAGHYAARVVFPYLLAGNVRDATKSLQIFLDRLTTQNHSIAVHCLSSSTADLRIFPSIPLLNFISLLLVAIKKGNPDNFRNLSSRYSSNIKEVSAWDDTLALVGELYFGISKPRQGNPLFDMMGSMFGGPTPAKPKPKRVGAGVGADSVLESLDVPIAEGLD